MAQGRDFIRTIIDRHLDEGRYDEVVTRFPPEPNGYLHIGHAKSICLNFGLADEFGGRCNLRYDDTNPLTEDAEFTASIARDVEWLGFEWDELCHASDYFDRLYEIAEGLIQKGKAYVDSASEAEIREARGTVTAPGRPTEYRDRSPEENLDLFRRMKAGEFPDGAHVLRAKADLSSPNMIMRDPVLYRIRHATHYRTGDDWCIYPLYDYAHCLEDAIEGVTHSLCTLEFDNNREIYDWLLDEAGFSEPRNHQYEFARLNLDFTVLSKRKLLRLVKEGHVEGWDDPRMPTLAGLRRRGVPPEAIRAFCDMIGVAKADSRVDIGKLEYAIRDTLNRTAPRVMGVLRPIRLVVTNWDQGPTGGEPQTLEVERFPGAAAPEGEAPTRTVRFARELWIDRDDFSAEPPEGWRRLAPGREVRLRGAYVLKCDGVELDAGGEVVGLRGSIDPETLGRNPEDRKVEGTIHWIAGIDAVEAEVRLYDRLFSVADPDAASSVASDPEGDFVDHLNPDSLEVLSGARVPAEAAGLAPGDVVQFEREGYFTADAGSTEGKPVLSRVVGLKDTWGKAVSFSPATSRTVGRPISLGHAPAGDGSRPPPTPQTAQERVSDQRSAARAEDPGLAARFTRYQDEFGLTLEEADVLTGTAALGDFFEAALAEHDDPSEMAAWVVNEVRALAPSDVAVGTAVPSAAASSDADATRPATGATPFPVAAAALGRLVGLVADGTISRRAGKTVLEQMVETGDPPEVIIEREGLTRVADTDALGVVVDEVLSAWPEKVAEYRAGNTNLLGLFMGQVMKQTGGSADPGVARTLLTEKLTS